MIYPFECKSCGKTEDVHASMKDAPPIGQQRPCGACGSNTLTRVLSLPEIPTAALKAAGQYPYVSRQWSGLPGTRQTREGHSIVESRQQEREITARTGLVRD